MALSSEEADFVLSSGYVRSAEVPFEGAPGFAIPLVHGSAGANATYIQKVDRKGKVQGFDSVEGAKNVISLLNNHKCELGNDEIVVVIDNQGKVVSGSKKEVVKQIKSWICDIENPLTRLAFARFCGDKILQASSAKAALGKKRSEELGEELSVSWFIGTAMGVPIVNALYSAAKIPKDFSFDRLYESLIITTELKGGRVHIRLVVDADDSIANRVRSSRSSRALTQVLNVIKDSSGYSVDIEVSADGVMGTEGGNLDERARRILRDVTSHSRQEERIAHLLAAVVADPAAGRLAVQTYSDHANFALSSIRLIQKVFSLYEKKDQTVEAVRQIISPLVASVYPLQKGRLLLLLATYLGSNPDLSSELSTIVTKSRSREVDAHRRQIMDRLL